MKLPFWPPAGNKKVIEEPEFMEAIERVIAGPERKSRLINENEKKIIAYHRGRSRCCDQRPAGSGHRSKSVDHLPW